MADIQRFFVRLPLIDTQASADLPLIHLVGHVREPSEIAAGVFAGGKGDGHANGRIIAVDYNPSEVEG